MKKELVSDIETACCRIRLTDQSIHAIKNKKDSVSKEKVLNYLKEQEAALDFLYSLCIDFITETEDYRKKQEALLKSSSCIDFLT